MEISSFKKQNTIYILFLIKILATLAFFDGSLTLFLVKAGTFGQVIDDVIMLLSIVTIHWATAFVFRVDAITSAIIPIVLMLVMLILLASAVITSIFGIKYKNAKKTSAFLITLIMLIELVVSFFVANIVLKVAYIIVSATMLVMCFRCVRRW